MSRRTALVGALALLAAGCTAAGAGTRGLPTPRPADVRASGTVSVFPTPGTPSASPSTTISFRDIAPTALKNVRVFGGNSGEHKGHFVAHSDNDGASFVPDQAFEPGEVVSVDSDLAVRGAQRGNFSFTISKPLPPDLTNSAPKAPTSPPPGTPPGPPLSFASEPNLHPPSVSVKVAPSDVANGDIFITPNPVLGQTAVAQSGPMIVDNRGRLVWFDPHAPATTLDLEEQQYDGQPVLSYFDGKVTLAGYGQGDFVLLNQHYQRVATVHAGNGYYADLHDFQIISPHTALVIAYNPVMANAATINRVYNRAVIDAVVQEIDIPTGQVLFEWHSLGTIGLTESYLPAPKSLTELYDYVHPNSVAVDADGNIWLSSRHTSTIYKIDSVTGALYWRLGGKENNFSMGSGTTFMWQHDVRPHAGNLVSVFDNAASAPGVQSRDVSNGLQLEVDQQAMKVSLTQSDDNPQKILSLSQGDYQELPNGDWLAGWGSQPEYTEFGPDGSVKLDVNINGGTASYRTFKFTWVGTPAAPPAVSTRTDAQSLTVAASWNGATGVARWQVLAGPSAGALAPVGTFPTTGFETTMRMPATARAPVVEVQALGTAGRVLGTSRATTVTT
jgi:hypothetical protein